jgi:tetratricopeptide (TPR) repeat protein
MARRIGMLFIVLLALAGPALATGWDAKGEAEAKEATRLFNLGKYEEAAPIYAKLAVDYPDMVVFLRNLGACNYYMGKPEPALSSLRRYLKLRTDIKPEDKATVERWIDEMEKLRAARLMPEEPETPGPTLDAGAAPVLPPAASAPPPAEVKPAGVEVLA